ncbi:MAG: MBL fold metallo-hydrolase [Pseudomonadota bacterium]
MALKIAERWFERRRIDDDITLLWEPHVVPLMRCNIWHVRGRDRDLMVDTGMGVTSLREATKDLIDKPVVAVATHSHADHMGGHHEFETCLVHRLEKENFEAPSEAGSLFINDFGEDFVDMLERAGYPVEKGQQLITALPHAGYDPKSYCLKPARDAVGVEEGHVVDLGGRQFEVLHLPGHSPGSMGLWEARTGTLFSGDCVYDGPLLDELDHSNIVDYKASMQRLRELPVRVVHAGHDPSFGGERLHQLIDLYLEKRRP